MTRRVDQWVPALHRGDAIGDSTLLMREALRSFGYVTDIYTYSQDEGVAALNRRVKESFDPKGILNPGRIWAGV